MTIKDIEKELKESLSKLLKEENAILNPIIEIIKQTIRKYEEVVELEENINGKDFYLGYNHAIRSRNLKVREFWNETIIK